MIGIRPKQPALRHGARVRLSDEEISRTCQAIVRQAPYLTQARYGIALEQLARLLARQTVIDRTIATHPKGWIVRATGSGKIEVNVGEKYYLALGQQIQRLLNDLGLTPAAARAMGLHPEAPDEKDLDALLREAAADVGTGKGSA